MNTPKHHPQPEHKVTFAGHFSVPLQGLVAPRHGHVLPPAVAQQSWQGKNWHEGRGGIFKSAQQTPAHVDLHIRVGAPWGQRQQVEEYNLSRRPR